MRTFIRQDGRNQHKLQKQEHTHIHNVKELENKI